MTTERRWRRRLSGIRVRVVVGYVLLLATALAIAVLVTRQVLLNRAERQITAALAQEVEELRLLAAGVDPATGAPFGADVAQIFDTFLRRSVPSDDEAYYSLVGGAAHLTSFGAPSEPVEDADLVRRWAAVTRPSWGDAVTGAGRLRYLAVPLAAAGNTRGVFVVAHYTERTRQEVASVVRTLTLSSAAVAVLATAVAWSLAGRVLRPVRRLTATARSITESELSQRIPVRGSDELAELGTTFNAMLDRLDHGFRSQREFLDDVAHELRTPITVVRGHLDLAGDDPAERAETMAIVDDELDRMSRYVNDLLLLAKSEDPDFLDLRPVDIGDLSNMFVQRVGGLGPRRWVVDEAVRPGMVAVDADPTRVMQALLNLATNAVQHTADGDELGFGAARVEGADAVQMWVRDTGPGIDPEALSSLFVRRFRGDTSRRSRDDGMGIGLSIVDAIARAHGGSVDAVNLTGGGAQFTIRLPITQSSGIPVEVADR